MKRVAKKKSEECGRPAHCVVRLAQHTLCATFLGYFSAKAPKRPCEALALTKLEHA
jgi:hypothetical protein